MSWAALSSSRSAVGVVALGLLAGCPGPGPVDGGPTDAGPPGCLDDAEDTPGAERHRFLEVSLVGGELIDLEIVRVPESGAGPPWTLLAAHYRRGDEDVCVTEAAALTYTSSPTGSSDAFRVEVADDTFAAVTTAGQVDPWDDDGNSLRLERFPLQLETAAGARTYGPVGADHEGPPVWPPVCPLDATLEPGDGGTLLSCADEPGPDDEVFHLQHVGSGLTLTFARRSLGEFSVASYEPFAATRFEVHGCGVDLCRSATPPDVDTCVAIPCPVETGELLYSVAYHNFTDWLRTAVPAASGDVVLRLDTRLSALAQGGWEYRLVGLDAATGRVLLGPLELDEVP